MTTYAFTLDDTTPKGKALLESLRASDDIIDLYKLSDNSEDWKNLTDEQEQKILGKLGQATLDSSDYEVVEVKDRVADYLKSKL